MSAAAAVAMAEPRRTRPTRTWPTATTTPRHIHAAAVRAIDPLVVAEAALGRLRGEYLPRLTAARRAGRDVPPSDRFGARTLIRRVDDALASDPARGDRWRELAEARCTIVLELEPLLASPRREAGASDGTGAATRARHKEAS
jgi:hypothetical protein